MKKSLLLILIPAFLLLFNTEALASCSWVQKETYYNQTSGKTESNGGCSDVQAENQASKCSGKKPTYDQQIGTAKIAVCCCDKSASGQIANNNICSWEKQSSYYDQTSRKTVTTQCSSGKSIYGDDNCSGKKPTYPTTNGVAQIGICCCQNGTINKNAASAKFNLPDYVFQIPIGSLSKLTAIDCSNSSKCEIPWIAQYISAVYNYGLSIGGIIAVLILMAAGLLWIVSGGDSNKINQAKKMIIGSVTGLILFIGMYVFLGFINPDLNNLKSISLDSIERKDLEIQADDKLGGTAEEFKNKSCATESELSSGIEFYATGYYKAPYSDNQTNYYLCNVAMQGTCPNGINTSGRCVENGKPIFPKYPNYQPCNKFSKDQYSKYFSGPNLIVGQTIAGPKCSNLPKNTKVCFSGKTYTITDSGGGIRGRRIDILSSSVAQTHANTGKGTLTKGACK